jgi:pimeloyl-ACP methyl ester carboxylesterase
MKPFYFGAPDEPLFGCYHFPQGKHARSSAIVLCYPMGQEYIRAHRAYLRMATRLSNAGYHVLRFDYFASGDSSGQCEQARVDRWQDDIVNAIEEVRGRSGSEKVCLIGLRLGGTLALLTGAERLEVEGIVLWDPVIDGASYADGLIASHQEFLANRPMAKSMPEEEYAQRLWFPLTAPLVADLHKINLLKAPRIPAKDILLIETNEEPQAQPLKMRLERSGARLQYKHQPDQRAWTKASADEFEGVQLISSKTLESIVHWVSTVCS